MTGAEGQGSQARVGLISLGCAKNRVDSEHLLGSLRAAGHPLTEDLATAEVLVVNTCGFIREAVEESIEEILSAARFKEHGACRVLAVVGCLVQRYPEIAAELPEVDLFATPGELPDLAALLAGKAPQERSQGRPGAGWFPQRVLSQWPHSSYLKVAEGCSNCCAYCTIPSIRGAFRSHPHERLLAEARALAAQGVVELNLVAQDVTRYGADLGTDDALARLLDDLEAIPGLRWLRLLYAYPRRLPPGVVERLGAGGKLVPYLDIPIQHSHPRVLAAMGRKTTRDEMMAVLDELRERVPGLVLRSTAIVGFPGETAAEFRDLLELVERVGFHHLGAFTYSPEEGTLAAALRPRVGKRTAAARLEQLLELQAGISEARNRAFVGRELDVLVDGCEDDGSVVGRTYGQAPEVDGQTRLPRWSGAPPAPGTWLRARITAAGPYDLEAEELGP